MRAYPAMKNTGVAWLGSIPVDWDLVRLKNIATVRTGSTPKGNDGVNVDELGYKWFTPSDSGTGTNLNSAGKYIDEKSVKKYKIQLFQPDSILFTGIGKVGVVGITNDLAYSNQQITAVSPTNIDSKFLFYVLNNSTESLSKIAPSTMLPIVNNRLLLVTPIALPDSIQQKKIAAYLDAETAKIDHLISKQEKLLGLLEEKRRATITSAVTTGLKMNATFKQTNIPWLGNVPIHWRLEKLKYVGQTIIGLTYSPSDLSDEGTMVLRSMNIAGGRINTDTQIFVSKKIPEKLLTREGDLLICSRNGSRKLIGKCGLIQKSQEGLTFGVFNTVYRSKHNKYVYYVLNSNIFYAQLGLFMTSTINQLTVNTLNNFEIALPPENEQMEIVTYLNRFENELDSLKQKVELQISLLKERRVSLILNVVTGKVKV